MTYLDVGVMILIGFWAGYIVGGLVEGFSKAKEKNV